MNVQQSDLIDPALVAEVDLARAAAQEEAGDERVGDYVEHQIEDSAAVTHLFEADKPGYRGWRWAVTITSAGPASDVTVSEVVLLPGPTALVAPEWIPWQQRVQAGDLGVGDLLPTSPEDPRLVPAYVASDDPAVEEVAAEVGLGRVRVMSRPARLDAADRWQQSDFGPRSDMARSAPAHCATCGFYLPLAGSLRAAFGTCGNEFSPADGHVVHVEYGCGAHSEAEVEQVSPVLVADLIYDDAQLDVEPLVVVDEVPSSDAVLEAVDASTVTPEGPEPASGDEAAPVAAGSSASEAQPPVESAESVAGEMSAEAGSDAAAEAGEPAAAEELGEASPAVEPVESAVAEASVEAGSAASAETADAPEVTSAEPGESADPAGSGSEVPGVPAVVPETGGSGPVASAEPANGSAVTTVEEPGAAGSDEPVGSAPDAGAPAESATSGEPEAWVGEALVVGSASGEDAAPAVIEPIATGETSGNDEPASRE